MANEMDDLLAELKAEYQPQKPKASQSAPPAKSQKREENDDESSLFDDLLADVKTEVEGDKLSSKQVKRATGDTHVSNQERFYEELKQQQLAREKAAQRQQEEKQREAEIAAKKRAEHRELRRKAALKEKARQWLQQLNFDSEEGKWFEEFSYAYDSQLEAAIDYLQAMKESGL